MKAKKIIVKKWLNCEEQFSVEIGKGKIVILHAFQMLCPGCVYHGIPQTIELFNKFNGKEVTVIGLHSVFENHDVMKEDALKVFIKEWRLPFPVGIDKHIDQNWMPETMKAYHFQGTPTTVIIDQSGELKLHQFGLVEQVFVEKLINDLLLKKQIA